MKKRITILLTLAICMLTLTAFPVEASPTLIVDPSMQYLGECVTITGSGFPPGETIELYEWNHADLLFDTVTVAEDGTFLSTLYLDEAIPNAWTPRTIWAWDTKGNLLASARVDLLPQEWWFEPTSGPPGTIVQFYGRGMPNQHDVGGYFDEEKITTFWPCGCAIDCYPPYRIQDDATPGWHSITIDFPDPDIGPPCPNFLVTSPSSVPEFTTIITPACMSLLVVMLLLTRRKRR